MQKNICKITLNIVGNRLFCQYLVSILIYYDLVESYAQLYLFSMLSQCLYVSWLIIVCLIYSMIAHDNNSFFSF